MHRRLLIFLTLFCFVLAGTAYELRVWEDVDGNQFEGRFLRELFGKLTIEAEDGTRKTYRLEKLSELDQKYLRVMVPPDMNVEIRSTHRSIPPPPMLRYPREYIRDDYYATVLITKKSQRPFTSRLKAEIFLIAEEVEGSNYVLMGRTEKTFLMPTISKGATVELRSNVVRTETFRDVMSGALKGEEFSGCLLVISTLQGDLVHTKSTLSPSWFEDPEVIKNLRELSITGAPSVCSRHFDKTGKKVPPPRPPHSGPTAG